MQTAFKGSELALRKKYTVFTLQFKNCLFVLFNASGVTRPFWEQMPSVFFSGGQGRIQGGRVLGPRLFLLFA